MHKEIWVVRTQVVWLIIIAPLTKLRHEALLLIPQKGLAKRDEPIPTMRKNNATNVWSLWNIK